MSSGTAHVRFEHIRSPTERPAILKYLNLLDLVLARLHFQRDQKLAARAAFFDTHTHCCLSAARVRLFAYGVGVCLKLCRSTRIPDDLLDRGDHQIRLIHLHIVAAPLGGNAFAPRRKTSQFFRHIVPRSLCWLGCAGGKPAPASGSCESTTNGTSPNEPVDRTGRLLSSNSLNSATSVFQ